MGYENVEKFLKENSKTTSKRVRRKKGNYAVKNR